MESLREMEVRSLRSDPLTVISTIPVSKLIGTLKQSNAYEVFIAEASRIGMVTMRDLLKVKNVSTSKVSTLVTHVPKLSPERKVGEAARIMSEYRIRALPIVDGNDFVGVMHARSILAAMKNSEVKAFLADKVMSSHPVTVNDSASVIKARNLMIRRDIDHLPVIGSKGLQGMLSSSHIVFNMVPPESLRKDTRTPESQRRLDMPVSALMNPDPMCCDANEKVGAILDFMSQRNVDYCLVKLWEELHGIITYRDLMTLLVERPESKIPVYIVGLPEDPFEAEAAKVKFARIVSALSKSYPSIEEARSKIKYEKREGKERRRYEVSVIIKTSKRVYSYSETGWDLPAVYDVISLRLKRLLTEKSVGKRRGLRSVRSSME